MSSAVLIPLFNSIASIIVAVIVALVGMAINKYVKDTNARNTLTTALSNASGVALSYGQANGDQFLQNHAVKSAALGAAMNYVADQAAQAKAHFGLTDADIATKITAHVAKSLSLATPIPPLAAPVVVVGPPPEPPETELPAVSGGSRLTNPPASPSPVPTPIIPIKS